MSRVAALVVKTNEDQGASGGLVYTDVAGATGALVSRRAKPDQGS